MPPTLSSIARTAALAAIAGALSGGLHAAPVPGTPWNVMRIDTQQLVKDTNDLVLQSLAEQMPLLLAMEGDVPLVSQFPMLASREFGDPREIVKNAPYTAEAVTESIQTLPDGNRIVKKSTTLLARDTMGRTRQERKGEGGTVYIHDPMENRSVAIDSTTKSVSRLPRVPMPPPPPVPPVPPAPVAAPAPSATPATVEVGPDRVIVRRGAKPADGASLAQEEVRVEVIREAHDRAMHALPPLPPITLPLLPRGKGETKPLGTRDFDGIKAEGTMTTRTIAAGAIGNEKPILITSERWFSPELFIVVYAKSSDPRAGETTYRLSNVKRGEPPADLFRIPSDAKVRETRK